MMTLARRQQNGTVKIRHIASEGDLPEKFLELILVELRNARLVESVRGAKGGYKLRRPPSEIRIGEIVRLIDGPLAPLGDADQLRSQITRDADHRALYQVFLDVRDAAANILDNTTLADLLEKPDSPSSTTKKRRAKRRVIPSVVPHRTLGHG